MHIVTWKCGTCIWFLPDVTSIEMLKNLNSRTQNVLKSEETNLEIKSEETNSGGVQGCATLFLMYLKKIIFYPKLTRHLA